MNFATVPIYIPDSQSPLHRPSAPPPQPQPGQK